MYTEVHQTLVDKAGRYVRYDNGELVPTGTPSLFPLQTTLSDLASTASLAGISNLQDYELIKVSVVRIPALHS